MQHRSKIFNGGRSVSPYSKVTLITLCPGGKGLCEVLTSLCVMVVKDYVRY